jgi:hypothetical protein
MTHRKHLGAAFAIAAFIGVVHSASAGLIVNSSVGGAPTGANYVNFDNLPLGNAGGTSGGIGVSFTSGDGGAVQGALSGRYAAPFLSGGNGSLFGNPANGADTTTYLSTGIGTITLTLPGPEKYFGLLWGSVDTYNSLELFNGASLVGTVTGTDVTAGANGNQGALGTFYVNISDDLAFNKVKLISTQYAFEFDNVAYGTAAAIPEPGTIAIFGAGLLAFGWLVRRKSGQNQA